MKTDIFAFELPSDRIANEPANPRESAKLLHIWQDGRLSNLCISDLEQILTPDYVLVFNDTKVIPARLYGKRGEAKIEMTLFKQMDLRTWSTLIKNARRLKVGDVVEFGGNLSANVIEKKENGQVVVAFNKSGAELMAALAEVGTMPLPPYIKRPEGGLETDKKNYQTAFAKYEGAVAAPTAGLHWTPELLQKLRDKDIGMEFVTLHVGGGTFLPVKVEDTDNHVMHAEYGIISAETSERLNKHKRDGKKIVAVGTTALRLLESAANDRGIISPFAAETAIFITPGYRFKFVDVMFTNFHLSESTLFMLVCAFAGIDKMKKAYTHAIENGYRFFSYGDACLIEKDEVK